MKITEDMLDELLLGLNERLIKDYVKEIRNKKIVFEMMQVKRISVYNNKEKIWITVCASDLNYNIF